jgi:hypothetical protein
MNNFYPKLAVLSVCMALSFTLGTNKEVKAATISLTSTGYSFLDFNRDGQADYSDNMSSVGVHPQYGWEARFFYVFNIARLSLAPNTVISSAVFEGRIDSRWPDYHYLYAYLNLSRYVGNGRAESSDFIGQEDPVGDSISFDDLSDGSNFTFDATTLINQIVRNGETFAEFNFYSNSDYEGYLTLDSGANLRITTVDVAEPVPEPATIFGSAIGLCLGGWLKRKKSTFQNKKTLQY